MISLYNSDIHLYILAFHSRHKMQTPDIGISLISFMIEDIKHYKTIEISIWLGSKFLRIKTLSFFPLQFY